MNTGLLVCSFLCNRGDLILSCPGPVLKLWQVPIASQLVFWCTIWPESYMLSVSTLSQKVQLGISLKSTYWTCRPRMRLCYQRLWVYFLQELWRQPYRELDPWEWLHGNVIDGAAGSCTMEKIAKHLELFRTNTVRPRGTRSMCPPKNRVPRNRLSWGLLLFTRVSKSEKNRVSWG